MRVVRAAWCGLTVLALVFAVTIASSTVSAISLSCRKTGTYDPPSTVRCDDSIVGLVGVWPLISLGLLLVAPPAVAAVLMRRRVSWSVVLVVLVLSAIGLAQWASFWGQLLVAVPIALVAVVIAGVQQVVSSPDRMSKTAARI